MVRLTFPNEDKLAQRVIRRKPICYRRVWAICLHERSSSRRSDARPESKDARQESKKDECEHSLWICSAGDCVYRASSRVEAGDRGSMASICCIGNRRHAAASSSRDAFPEGRRRSTFDLKG